MHRAVVTLEGADADIVRRALQPEAGRDLPRATVAIAGLPGRVVLTIEAEDTAALRAALNSYLRWADVALRVRAEVRS